MFILIPEQFADNGRENVEEFINFWKNHYLPTNKQEEQTNEALNYFTQLNIGHQLTAQNVTELLRWKLPRLYTHPRKRNGSPNTGVVRIIHALEKLNHFRQAEMVEDEFRNTVQRLIPTEGTMQIFLFHICRPWQYPIADKNVFRVFYRLIHNQSNDVVTWDIYLNGYIDFFKELAEQYGVSGNPVSKEYVQQLKVIDNALMAFGRFLGKYDMSPH
jgi:hypothetical protein